MEQEFERITLIKMQPPPVRREERPSRARAGYFLRNGCRICNALYPLSLHTMVVQPLSPCFVYGGWWAISYVRRNHWQPYPHWQKHVLVTRHGR